MNYLNIPDVLIEALKQLTKNGDIKMAGLLLNMYFIRNWKVKEPIAKHYTIKWFEKYFPNELKRYFHKG